MVSRVSLDDIELGGSIGGGTFGMVYKAKMAGKAIAVKKMDCSKNEIPREVQVHSTLPSHPNVLPLVGIAHSKNGFSIYICTELAERSLHHYLHDPREKRKPTSQRKLKWAMQVAEGMHHIHKNKLAHRDLKSANVLLFERGSTAKVCDFGSTKPMEVTASVSGMQGTHRWMAPEFNDKASTKVNQRCDVFSYGMVLYEIFTGNIPFSEIEEDVEVASSISAGKRPSIPSRLPLHMKVLMKSCWEQKSHDRPTFEAIVEVLKAAPTSEEKIQDVLSEKTSLHRAAESGDANAVKQLVSSQVDINTQIVDGKTALHLAAQRGHIHVVQALIDHHADINLQDEDGCTALYYAALKGHIAVVRVLLEQKADVKICTINGQSPLYAASEVDHAEVVDILAKSGANPYVRTKEGASPLFRASSLGLTDVVDVLLKSGTNPNQDPIPLGIAAMNGHARTVERLLKGGSFINYQTEDGATALFVASQEGHVAVVDTLLKNGADPNLVTSKLAPLGRACQKGHVHVVEKLLEGKANINYRDAFGCTALTWASWEGNVEIVKLLLQYHADVNISDKEGDTPIDTARSQGHADIVQLLQQNL